MTRPQLRQQIQKQRSQLSPAFRHHAARQILKRLINTPLFLRSEHIAFYIPVKGEINPLPLLKRAARMQKKCYLPILHPLKKNLLWFCRYRPGDELIPNRFGILEPAHGQRLIKPFALDLVMTPLVAFDDNKNRLGMGAGFYDRTFSFLLHSNQHKPNLIGLAYEFQKISNGINAEQWDVPLQMVVTEKNIYI